MVWDAGMPLAAPVPVLQVLEVRTAGSLYVRNLDTVPLTLIFDQGAPPASLITPLVPGAVSAPMPAFTGRVQVVGPTGTQFTATAS